MYEGKTVVAVILARGGSKRLPGKNILTLGEKPLVAWSIEAGVQSRYVDAVYVSSDDDTVLEIAADYGAGRVKRPAYLASDTATSFDAVAHILDRVGVPYDYVLLLQPTSPLRRASHVDGAIEQLFQCRADAVVSVCETEHSPLWSHTLPESGCMETFVKNIQAAERSQDLPTYYRLNGAIYICKRDRLLQEKRFLIANNIVAYRMPREVSVDIDDALDFQFAAFLLQHSVTT